MFVGALLDAGAGSLQLLQPELEKIDIDGWSIATEPVKVSGIAATWFSVEIEGEEQEPRSLSDIEELIASSGLSEKVRSHCLAIFGRVARAEAKAHGESLQTVHFHEVGMVDSIIDIVSTCVLFEELKPREIFCSPVALGSGTVQTRHGMMPVPSPATALLLEGVAGAAGRRAPGTGDSDRRGAGSLFCPFFRSLAADEADRDRLWSRAPGRRVAPTC